jgi:hypothetical protein
MLASYFDAAGLNELPYTELETPHFFVCGTLKRIVAMFSQFIRAGLNQVEVVMKFVDVHSFVHVKMEQTARPAKQHLPTRPIDINLKIL